MPLPQSPDRPSVGEQSPNMTLRKMSFVFGGIALAGFLTLAYQLIWVEKLSGQEVFKKTFLKARIVRRQVAATATTPLPRPSDPTGGAPQGPRSFQRQEEVIETVHSMDKLGPVKLKKSHSPCRLFIDVDATIFDPGELREDGRLLICELSMIDQFGNERWKIDDAMARETMSEREMSSYAMAVHEFDVPYDGEFTFKPKLDGPGVFVRNARLTIRSNVQRSSATLMIVAAVMFFLGLLVAISCSKAYELSKPESERSAWVDQPLGMGDTSLARPQASASPERAEGQGKQHA